MVIFYFLRNENRRSTEKIIFVRTICNLENNLLKKSKFVLTRNWDAAGKRKYFMIAHVTLNQRQISFQDVLKWFLRFSFRFRFIQDTSFYTDKRKTRITGTTSKSSNASNSLLLFYACFYSNPFGFPFFISPVVKLAFKTQLSTSPHN